MPELTMHKSALRIQHFWKKYMLKKKVAARKIQNWYRKIKNKSIENEIAMENEILTALKPTAKKILSKNITKQKYNVRNEIQKIIQQNRIKNQEEEKNSKRNSRVSPTISENSRNTIKNGNRESRVSEFSPTISENSRILAKSKQSQFDNLSLVDRFKILEANRQENIHKKRQAKIEKETESHIPTINTNDTIKNTFEERQEKYMKNYKMKYEQKAKVVTQEEFPFKPSINKSLTSRESDRSIEDLYNWAKLKESKLSRARDAKLEIEKDQIVNFKLSENTLNLSFNRKNKIEQEMNVNNQLKRESSPYWPIN